MEIIEGFKAYSPEVAYRNDGFNGDLFDTLAEIEEKSFWFRSRNKIIQHLFSRFNKGKRNKFLELGCGTGFVLKGLKEHFNNNNNLELIGSEIHINGLHHAKKRMPDVNFIQLDATKMPFYHEFDSIGAFDVIEHISDDELVLANCYKALKPGGHIYITVPQYMFMWSYLDDLAFHKRRYSKRELITKTQATGFEVVYCGSFVCFLFPVMLLSRIIKGKRISSKNIKDYELSPGKLVNSILSLFMRIDEFFIQHGIQLPWGGSLVMVAVK